MNLILNLGPADFLRISSFGFRIFLLLLLSVAPVYSQATPNEDSEREARLAFFKERAAEFQLVVGADRVAQMTPPPVFRGSHPAGTTVDAALFVWMDGEQPVALGSILIHREMGHFGELQSVTAQSLKAVKKGTTVWQPAKPGCQFARVANAPQPAESATERLTQMKVIARRFGAELIKGPPVYSEGSIWRLRLLPKQLVRYGGPRATVLDGAIFALCHDTDPEVILLLEASGEKADVAWHFAFAPLTGWKATGTCDEKVVWSQPQLSPMNARKLTYMTFIPTPPFTVQTRLQGGAK